MVQSSLNRIFSFQLKQFTLCIITISHKFVGLAIDFYSCFYCGMHQNETLSLTKNERCI